MYFQQKQKNTDGITAMVPRNKVNLYYELCKKWEEKNNFKLEFNTYKKCIIKDVNSYLWVPEEGNIKYKGFFDKDRHLDVTKSFDKPIVSKAVYKFFIENIPVEETIQNSQSIYDFCMAQKAGNDFSIKYNFIKNGRLETIDLQKTNRYYVGRKGGTIFKQNGSKKIGIIAGEPVYIANDIDELTPIEDYNIKYEYYIKEANKVISLFNYKQLSLF